MKNILVTGGAGFIGSHLTEALIKDKKVGKVICVDNMDDNYPADLRKENLSSFKNNKKFKLYKTDIRDLSALRNIFKKEKPEVVIHLAAKTDTRTSVAEPLEYETVNIGGTLNLLELSKDFNIKKFIFASSSSVYGNSAVPPIKETEITDFPLSPYGATKKTGEILSYTYSYNHALPVVCLRFFNVYGERMKPVTVLPKWVKNIFDGKEIEMSGKGTRKRDFTYVGDLVDAIIKSISKGGDFSILNIASSRPVSLRELLKVVEQKSKKKAIVKERESNRASIEMSHANISNAKKTLGWNPKVSLEEGVRRYVSWFSSKNR
jgi:UDP-glucuronate 4-epimerase